MRNLTLLLSLPLATAPTAVPAPSALTVALPAPVELVTMNHARLLDDTEFCDLFFTFEAAEFKKETVTAHVPIVSERVPLLLDESKYCAK